MLYYLVNLNCYQTALGVWTILVRQKRGNLWQKNKICIHVDKICLRHMCYPFDLKVSAPTSAVVREGCVENESGSLREFWREVIHELLQKKMEKESGTMPTWPKACKSLSRWWPSS